MNWCRSYCWRDYKYPSVDNNITSNFYLSFEYPFRKYGFHFFSWFWQCSGLVQHKRIILLFYCIFPQLWSADVSASLTVDGSLDTNSTAQKLAPIVVLCVQLTGHLLRVNEHHHVFFFLSFGLPCGVNKLFALFRLQMASKLFSVAVIGNSLFTAFLELYML